MSPTEALPLLVVAVLLVSASGADPARMEVTFAGEHEATAVEDVLVAAGGSTTVPAGASVAGDVYVTGGSTRVEGRIEGDVTVLAGEFAVAEGATVTGTVRTVTGESRVAPGATVGRIANVEAPAPTDSPVGRAVTFVLQFAVLGGAGWWLTRRRPALLENVGHAMTEHALVSGVVGSLAATSLLVLLVYMAFTLLLLPVSVLGLVGELGVVLYGQVALGHVVGTRLPVASPARATVAGVGGLLLALELAGAVPLLGGAVQVGVAVVGFGAVLNTYFGLRRFEPAAIPEAAP